MIIYFVILASSFRFTSGCLHVLEHAIYNYNDFVWIRYNNGTTDDVNLYYRGWPHYGYGAGVFATTIVCLFGWVSLCN